MAKQGNAYVLIYDEEVHGHLRAIDRKYHRLIRREIERQLVVEPEKETTNKKPLRRPSALGAARELRFGPENRFRVFYKTSREKKEVYVLAVGVKIRNRLFIGGEEFAL